MRIALSALAGLMICVAAATGIYYYPVAPPPAIKPTPQDEQVINPPAPSQADQTTEAPPAVEQPVSSPVQPAPLPPRIVKTESITPPPDGAAGSLAQQTNTAANAQLKVKKHKKKLVRPKKHPLKTVPAPR